MIGIDRPADPAVFAWNHSPSAGSPLPPSLAGRNVTACSWNDTPSAGKLMCMPGELDRFKFIHQFLFSDLMLYPCRSDQVHCEHTEYFAHLDLVLISLHPLAPDALLVFAVYSYPRPVIWQLSLYQHQPSRAQPFLCKQHDTDHINGPSAASPCSSSPLPMSSCTLRNLY